MPIVGADAIVTHPKSSVIFSQGDREMGSRARFFGFTQHTDKISATQSKRDRWLGMTADASWAISEKVIAACIEVHRHLGPGLLESIYESALCAELQLRGVPFQRQCPMPVRYKGIVLDQTYRADLIVGGQLLVEVKSVDRLLFAHVAQTVTYLRVTDLSAGLIVNFNTALIRDGLRRVSLHPKHSHDSRSPDLPVKFSSAPPEGFSKS